MQKERAFLTPPTWVLGHCPDDLYNARASLGKTWLPNHPIVANPTEPYNQAMEPPRSRNGTPECRLREAQW